MKGRLLLRSRVWKCTRERGHASVVGARGAARPASVTSMASEGSRPRP
jgi:hypothetical protein